MVCCSVNDDGRPTHFANDAADVTKQVFADFRFNHWLSLSGAENEMNQDIRRRMRHVSYAPLGLALHRAAHPRLTPWALFSRRSAAQSVIREPCVVLATEEGRKMAMEATLLLDKASFFTAVRFGSPLRFGSASAES
jgi:hypothetical protein